MNLIKVYSTILFFLLFVAEIGIAQQVPPEVDMRMYDIIQDVSSERIENDIRILAGFGTRNTLSDTISDSRGIGAARRWIKKEFDR